MNVFTTTAFLEIAGALFFPRRKRSVELFRVDGRLLRLLVLDGRQPVRTMPFYDFPQPLEGAADGPVRELAFFPRSVVRTTTVEARTEKEPTGYQPSPYIDWSTFPDFAAYEALVRSRKAMKNNDSERQRRRLAKEVGEVRFEFDDPRPEVFDSCITWKSAQYLATGVGDAFAEPAHVELFRQLRAAGLLVVSSFSAGGKLLAAHLGSMSDRRLGWWIPSYDSAFHKYSPGRLLMSDLMRASYERQHVEFDFLIGDEDYKFNFATHNRVIGPLGTRPLAEQVLLEARQRAKAWLTEHPRAYELAREAKRRVETQLRRLRR